jgi:hypothetical protein
MLLQMQRLEAKEWLGGKVGEGCVKAETVVDLGPKARPKRPKSGWHCTHFGEFHALLVGTLGQISKCCDNAKSPLDEVYPQ